jgi:hypothetical protein
VSPATRLAPSNLSDQKELLKDDLDLQSIKLAVKGKASLEIRPRVTGAPVARTMDGASSLTLNVRDRDRHVWTSGYIAAQVDTEIDGLWFRLKGYDKTGDDVTLTFEDREVAVLRDFPLPNDPHRYLVRDSSTTTRLEFAKLLVAEAAKVVPIRFVTPDTFPVLLEDNTKPLEKKTRTHARGLGFAPGADITVKSHQADRNQLDVLDRVLSVGTGLKARRKVLVAAVMVVTQETTAGKDLGTDPNAIGVFQQNPHDGWPATGIVEPDATAFFQAAITDDHKHPNLQDWELGQDVQASANGHLYAQWKTEAERTVDAWGATSDTSLGLSLPPSTDKSFQFTRGTLSIVNGQKVFTREDNWSCLQRLAAEVNWRCFAVSGTVYFMPDLDLLASQPLMRLSEESEGIDSIDGSGDEGRRSVRKGHRVQQLNQQAKITCRIGRWAAPPGSCVELVDSGPLDGRWLVASVTRDLFTPDGVVTLKRPQTALPEARAPEYLSPGGGQLYTPPTSSAITPGGQFVAAGSLVQPIPKAFDLSGSPPQTQTHLTENLETYPAYDFMAHAGSPVIAPEAGTIHRPDGSSGFSGHDPALGPVAGPHGPFGWTVYLLGESGTSYYITHLGSRTVQDGQKVGIATQIGTVGDYARWGGADHAHVGVRIGDPVTIEMLGVAPLAEKAVVDPGDALHHR